MADKPRPPTPYEKFLEATKAILRVPKAEVDKARRHFRRRQKRKR